MDTLPQIKDIKTLRRLLVKAPNQFEVVEEPFEPNLSEGQLLVKVHAAPINPLDINRLTGKTPNQVYPFTLGSECSGTIIYPDNLRGKRASFYVKDGSFRQYAIGQISDTLIFSENADLDQIACAFINPLTAVGLLDFAKQHGAQTVVNTAANSQLGTMIYRLAQSQGIQTINLVRTQKRVQEFTNDWKAQHVLDIQSETFQQDLRELVNKLNATICLDAYGGDVSGQIFNALPKNGQTLVYGSLISTYLNQIDGMNMRWLNKQISGYILLNWLAQVPVSEKQPKLSIVIDRFDEFFKSKITNSFPLENFGEALEAYKADMGAGKILVKL